MFKLKKKRIASKCFFHVFDDYMKLVILQVLLHTKPDLHIIQNLTLERVLFSCQTPLTLSHSLRNSVLLVYFRQNLKATEIQHINISYHNFYQFYINFNS